MAAFMAGGMTRRYLFGFGVIALIAVAGLVVLIDYRQTVGVRAAQIAVGGALQADVPGDDLAAQELVPFGEAAAPDPAGTLLGRRMPRRKPRCSTG